MALNNLGLGFVFTAKDLASAKIRGLEKDFRGLDSTTEEAQKKFSAGLVGFTKGAGLVTAGAVGIAGSFKLAGTFGNFEQGLAKVRAIAGITAGSLEATKLEAAALQAGLDTQFSPQQAVEGLANLAAVGFTAQEQIDSLNPSLDLAAGGMIEVSQATATVSSALKVFGLQSDQAGIAADKLLKISNLTALQAADLELALGTVARGAGATKQNLDEMLISMGLVKNTGVSASVAASSTSIALLNIAKNSKKFKKELGVSVTDSQGKFKDFITIVREVEEKTKGITNEAKKAKLLQELFGRGLTSVVAINKQINEGIKGTNGELVKGAAAVDLLRSRMKGAEGTAESFRKQMQAGFKGQVTLLKGSLATLAIALGKPMAEILKPVIKGLIVVINAMIKAFSALPGPVQKMIALLPLLASGFLVAKGAMMVFRGASVLLGPAMAAMKVSMLGALAPLVPFLPIILGVAAAIGILVFAFKKNIGGFGDAVNEAFADLKEVFGEIVDLVMNDLVPLFADLLKSMVPLFKMIIAQLVTVIKFLVPILKLAIKIFVFILKVQIKIITALMKIFINVVRFLVNVFTEVANVIASAFTMAMGVIGKVADFIGGIVDTITGWLDSLMDLIDDVVDAAKAVGDFVGDAASGVGDFFADTINPFSDDFLTAPSAGGGGGEALAGGGGQSFGEIIRANQAQPTQVNIGEQTTRVSVELDGEKVGEAVAKNEAKRKQREFGDGGRQF